VLYLNAAGILVEKVTGSGGTVTWNNYLFVAGKMIGMRVETGATVQTRYFHRDHLGSVAVLTNETGAVAERLSYDAWANAASRTAPTIRPAASPARPPAASPAMKSWTTSI
jgi:uncharacterized protein RhaS with RHS repeats